MPLPAVIMPDEDDEARRVVEQLAENDHRAEVEAALTVAASKTATKATAWWTGSPSKVPPPSPSSRTTVRGEWMTAWATGTTAPKGVETFLAVAIAHDETNTQAALVGRDRASVTKTLRKAAPRTALRHAAGLLLGSWHAKSGRHTWRNPTEQGPALPCRDDRVGLRGRRDRAGHRQGEVAERGGGRESDRDDQDEHDDDEKEAKKRRNGVSAVCGCQKPRRIRVAWTVWETGPISCGARGQDFHDPDATEQDDDEQEGDE